MTLKGSSLLFGVVGHPISHSLSPVFQNTALEYLGIDAVYIPFDVPPESFRDFIEGMRALKNLVGLNVTVPHKEVALRLADRVSDEAKAIGAVNTLKFSEGLIEAYNTDWIGFLKTAQMVTELKGKKVLVLGAGGASRAVLYALKKAGAKVYLWNRTQEKARSIAEEFGVQLARDIKTSLMEVEVVVNTTSVGLRDDDPPLFDYNLLTPDKVVIDIIYKETPLLRRAREIGCKSMNGFPMLVYQGAESLRLWTGCEPPLKVMELSLRDYGYPIEHSRNRLQTFQQPS